MMQSYLCIMVRRYGTLSRYLMSKVHQPVLTISMDRDSGKDVLSSGCNSEHLILLGRNFRLRCSISTVISLRARIGAGSTCWGRETVTIRWTEVICVIWCIVAELTWPFKVKVSVQVRPKAGGVLVHSAVLSPKSLLHTKGHRMVVPMHQY